MTDMQDYRKGPSMPDHAVCPTCGKVTEWTDEALHSEPELIVECDHCGAEINLYYADYVEGDPSPTDDDELENLIDQF